MPTWKKTYLGLEKVGRHDFAPVTVEERESSAEGWGGDSPKNSLGNDAPPAWLSGVHG